MSLTSAFNGALSGLQAFEKMSEAISANIANSTTPGYGVRSVELASNADASGVAVRGTTRLTDPVILSARRSTEAQFSNAQVSADFQNRFMAKIGTPDDPMSLSGQLAGFETSLIEAASAPDAPARLDSVVAEALNLTDALNGAARLISNERSAADAAISEQVNRLNTTLKDVDAINTQITVSQARGMETSALVDQRQRMIDEINSIIPIKEIARPNGQVALFTEGGAILLDGTAAELGFSATNTVTPYQSLDAGTLSGLTINGVDVWTESDRSPLRGGTLIAQFAVRDEAAVAAQSQLDAVARDLIHRFQDPALDSTLAAGVPGIFTDDGAAFSAANELGIANRISINGLLDTNGAPETWRLRSGFGAAAPGPVGEARLLNAMAKALNQQQIPASGDFGPGAATSADLLSRFASWAGTQSATAERGLSFASASYSEASQAELSRGVDTDTELQNLLVVEQAYAANAQVLQTIDEMMDTILRIG